MRPKKVIEKGHGFGTSPVFLAAISTILGAVLFLRFGYAVGHAGMLGAIVIVIIGHLITIPTALAIAEIATNLRVEGGGEYYIISRSFGLMIGGAIGISLYLSQAVSVSFYMIAFSQAFTPLFGKFQELTGIVPDPRMISLPATFILLFVILKKGANLGVTVLWIVSFILFISLLLFFVGKPYNDVSSSLSSKIVNHDNFFKVFAIVFPAFTGMTAGVGLSGDLKNPRKSLPLGTLSATLVGMVVYILVILKLASSASPDFLATDQLIMSKIAIWGPIIPIGLAAATLSSAIGSLLIAPRTLQALSADDAFPITSINSHLKKGIGKSNEPVNATYFTAILIILFVALGNIDYVAQIISMFFMITYGTLCLVSFLEHFGGNPSYRPTFRSKWYLSLIGALASFFIMFQMQPVFATLAIFVMGMIYYGLKRVHTEQTDLSIVFKGVLFQITRQLHILMQKKQADTVTGNWRPAFIAISSDSLTRLAPYDLLRWISYYYGFGTFFHYIQGSLNTENVEKARGILAKLIKQGISSEAGIYADTIISPSFKTAVAQIIQAPGIFGIENNSILLEFHQDDQSLLPGIVDGCNFAAAMGFSTCVLRSSERHFGYHKKIHLWLTPGDYRNANLMILLAFIIMGHPDWKNCTIDIFAAFHNDDMENQVSILNKLIDDGRLPISHKSIQKVPYKKGITHFEELVQEHSENADLIITGFSVSKLINEQGAFFINFKKIKDILFVRAGHTIILNE